MAEDLITCTRRYQFCAGHRVVGHESRCANLHGHNYVALFEAQTSAAHGRVAFDPPSTEPCPEHGPAVPIARLGQLDEVGRVVDFAVLKAELGGWIDREWDHRFLVWEEDGLAHYLDARANRGDEPPGSLGETMSASLVRVPFNPTAENMARHLLHEVAGGSEALRAAGVRVTRVRLWETENCYADAWAP
jgi:6-pyruvoyltetrahydropterin/6-carboxytetrahydropterin synthase